jgi:hypothetical protein
MILVLRLKNNRRIIRRSGVVILASLAPETLGKASDNSVVKNAVLPIHRSIKSSLTPI